MVFGCLGYVAVFLINSTPTMLEKKRNQKTQKSKIRHSTILLFGLVTKTIGSSRSLRLSLLCTLFVWTLWL